MVGFLFLWGEKMSKTFYNMHHVNVGKRYVFFSTLPSETIPIYKYYWYKGKEYVKEAQSLLKPDPSDSPALQNIQAYIDLVHDAAIRARAIEDNFFEQIQDYIKGNDALKAKIKDYLALENRSNFNYLQFIVMLNEIMLENNKLNQEIQERQQHNMEVYDDIVKNLDKETKETVTKSYQAGYSRIYGGILNRLAREGYSQTGRYDKKLVTTVTNALSARITSAMNTIITSPDLKQPLVSMLENKGISKDDVEQYIAGYIVDVIFSKEIETDMSDEDIAHEIMQRISGDSTQISKEFAETVYANFSSHISRSHTIEEMVFFRESGIYKVYQDLTPEEKKMLAKEYNIDITQLKNAGSRKAVQLIREGIIKSFEIKSQKVGEQIVKEIEAASQNKSTKRGDKHVSNYKEIRQKIRANSVLKNVSLKIAASSVSELLLTHIGQVLSSTVRGVSETFQIGQLNLKTDNIINFLLPSFLEQEDERIRTYTLEVASQVQKDALTRYKKEAGGEIDVDAAVKAFKSTNAQGIGQIQEFLQKVGKTTNEINATISELSNFISASISVKDYFIYLNEEGFHAGSLGSTATKAINNIIRMYELGGITDIDRNLLLFAVNNCTEATVGGQELYDSLTTFLLGGAALLTFDEGFTLLKKFQTDNPDMFLFQNKMCLYNLEGRFIPASYVLTSIYENLNKIYNNQIMTLTEPTTTNKVVIKNNLFYDKAHSLYPEFEEAQDRWDITAERAAEEVKIEMEFMGGLLDIYHAIGEAFSPKNTG